MEQYNVTGMSCAACVARIEKAVSQIEGVDSVSVSLLTNSMAVDGTADSTKIIKAVTDAGYGASKKGESNAKADNTDENALEDKETPKLKKRLIASLVLLIPLMYVSMGHMMFGWPILSVFEGNYLGIAILQMLFTIAIMIINKKFFVSGFKSLWHKAPNMDTLVALGSGASFVYSLYSVFAMTVAITEGNLSMLMPYMHELYFESAAMILTLITVGKMLEAHSKGKTTNALKSLMSLAPKTANVIRNEKEININIRDVIVGDIFVVRPGESIPVDGIVIEGNSAVDEAALTGESIPVDKDINDNVSAATINQSGFLKCRATRVGEDTTLSQIIQMVSDAAATKAPIAKVADKVSGVFVPVVIVIAIVTTLIWLLVGKDIGFALSRGIAVLVISCPCALGLATPVAIMVGNGMGAKNAILFKTAISLENSGKLDIIALDKTGTITVGQPKLTDIITTNGYSGEELMQTAFSLEQKSEHPLARAIVEYANENDISAYEVTEFAAVSGNGLSAYMQNEKIAGGNLEFISRQADITDEIKKAADELSNEGKTPLFFAKGKSLLGIIAVADIIKEDSPKAIKELQNMGIKVVMLTGDNERTAKAIGNQAGVNEVIAGVLPSGKEEAIKKLKKEGRVAMVGDGINDAPALTRADIGMAIGAGTDVAIDAADVVLMKNSLLDVAAAIRLSRAVLKNIHENLFWAFIYNIIGIPLAAGVWYPVFGWKLNPMFGAAAMSLSSFCVVTNALRINFVNIHNSKNDKKRKQKENKKKEVDVIMEKTMKINGMMCGHCEATVKKALEELPQVDEAIVSHESNTAIVKLNADIDNEELKKAVEAKDYEVVAVE